MEIKKLIRKGVFETNSSSCHSISIADDTKEFVLDTIYPDQEGKVYLSGGNYGWDWFKSNESLEKANYAAQQFEHSEDDLEILKKVIRNQTGAEEVIISLNDGYVDHDSVGIVSNDEISLKNFIFNKNSWLFGGNDNNSADPTFYHVPEFRGGKQILPKYKFELVIEGIKETTKYLSKPSNEELSDGIESIVRNYYLYDLGFIKSSNDIFESVFRKKEGYEIAYNITQDYSKNEIIFTKENSSFKLYDIRDSLEKEHGKLGWKKINELLTKEVLKLPNFTKIIKFSLNEI